MDMYLKEGFQILPAELKDKQKQVFATHLPWDIIELIKDDENWSSNSEIANLLHSSSIKIWNRYRLGEKVRTILSDPIIGDDGDITESRDYNSYVRQMDEIAELKYQETVWYVNSRCLYELKIKVLSKFVHL